MEDFFDRCQIRRETNKSKRLLPLSLALTNEMVGLLSKDSEVVEEKVKVVKAKVKAVDSQELLGWGWQVLAVEIEIEN